MTRDNIVWTITLIAGIATGLSAHFDLFPWIPPTAQHVVELVGFIAGLVGAKLAMSPLPLSPEGKVAAQQGKL